MFSSFQFASLVAFLLSTHNVLAQNLTSKGCYQEPTAGKRALAQFKTLVNGQMSSTACQTYCFQFQTTYFGLEGGNECHCGNNISALKLVESSKCTQACSGNNKERCGQGTSFLNLYEADTSRFNSTGAWGPLITFPNVPVAVALLPDSGNLLTWSSGWIDRWTTAGNGKTYTSIYDVSSKTVSQLLVTNTQHDMFCPGVSMLEDGRINVNGGSTAAKTTIYDYKTGTWTGAGNMMIPRGYQSSTLTSDGLIFTIGGSFSGAGVKDGEVFNPVSNTWSKLRVSPARPAAINQGVGMGQDSHAWLFAWKDGFVFQAGPSKQMNWYGTRGAGGQKTIGNRGNDDDAMCGVFVMYDATKGKIFTLGGSRTYGGSASTSNANIITIGAPNETVSVEPVTGAKYPRTFANSVVMPDGKIFIAGGMTYSQLFSDNYPVFFPEIFDPNTKSFTTMKPHYTPRNYHSVALLMQDGTIFVGGGGLCGAGCAANHFDGEFFSPPYLFQADGKTPAARPSIESVSGNSANGRAAVVKLGGQLQVRMANAGDYTFSLIRLSTVTHAVNTDQRRIPLAGGSGSDFSLTVPSDAGVALPGFWMLFAVDKNGVPSVAKTVQIVRT